MNTSLFKSNQFPKNYLLTFPFVVVADVFTNAKVFNWKVGQEIRQKLTPLGFELEFQCNDDKVFAKVCQWCLPKREKELCEEIAHCSAVCQCTPDTKEINF